MSDKNKKLGLEFAKNHTNWTIKRPGNRCRRHDFCFGIVMVVPVKNLKLWIQRFIVLMVRAGGCQWRNGMKNIFLAYIWTLCTNKTSFKWCTLTRHSVECIIYDYSAPILWWSSPTGQCTIWQIRKSDLHCHQLSILSFLWDVMESEFRVLDVQPTDLELLDLNFKRILPEHCWIHAKKT